MNQLPPQWMEHVYWLRKEHFLLPEDTYNTWTMFIIEKGQFQFRINQHTGIAGAGDVVVCPPFVPFHRETISPLSFHFVRFSWERTDTPISEAAMPSGLISLAAASDRLADNCEQLRRYELTQSPWEAEIRRHLLLDIWFMTMREWRDGRQSRGALPSASLDADMTIAAKRIQESTLSGTLLKSVADELGMTPVQLTRRFKAAYGESPQQYAISARLRKACQLLDHTDWTLDVIARECGYENGFYLSRIFHKHMKQRPSEYRSSRRL